MKSERDLTPPYRASRSDAADSFDCFYAEYSDRVNKYCAKLLSRPLDNPDVKDLIGNTWHKAFIAWNTFEGRNGAKRYSWVCAISRYQYLNDISLHHNSKPKVPILDSDIAIQGYQYDFDLELGRIAKELTFKQLGVIYLSSRQFSGKQMAEILGIPKNTVHSRLRRARKTIKRYLSSIDSI